MVSLNWKSLLTFLVILFVRTGNAVVPLSEFFPYGRSAGDAELAANDDGSTNEISISPFVFPFVNNVEKRLWLNNNGDISFAKPIGAYNPICGPLDQQSRMVAVFWTDIDTRNGGQVFYRHSTDRNLLRKAANDVIKRYPNMVGLKLEWLFISSWVGVAPFKGDKSKRDTFQLILATDGALSFAIMYYNKLEWSNGNGGDAKAGFDVGDGKNFFKVEASCEAGIIHLVDWSNMNVPGKFVFRVDNLDISTKFCDEIAYENGKQRLKVSPSVIDTMGHVPVAFQGPCFDKSAVNISCTFDDLLKGTVTVAGTLVMPAKDAPTVYCTAPYLYGLGRTDVTITLAVDGHNTKTYQAYLSVAALTPPVNVNKIPTTVEENSDFLVINESNVTMLEFTWNRLSPLLEGVSLVDIAMNWYDPKTDEVRDLLLLAGSVPNTGHAIVNYTEYLLLSNTTLVVTFSISPRQAQQKVLPFLAPIGVRLFSRLVIITVIQTIADFENTNPPINLPPCPCAETQAKNDPEFTWDGMGKLGMDFFHPGGVRSYRDSAGKGQQCVYDSAGKILVGPPGGGTADHISPQVSYLEHFYYDVAPWFVYCFAGSLLDLCDRYYQKRPSDNCGDYVPPRPAQVRGDPHITTFDYFDYTFNGAGEFTMAETINRTFVMQARMEPFGSATLCTAFAMRQDKTIVQIQQSQTSLVDVLVDKHPIEFSDPALTSQTFNRGEVTIVALNRDLSLLSVSFSCGVSFVFSSRGGAMAVTATASGRNMGKISGLLGDYDGNPENDLKTPNGEVLPPRSSLSDIHWKFGLKWMVKKEESLFYYLATKSHDSYAKPNFTPKFDLPDLNSMPLEAKQVCGTSIQCLFDYAATGGDLAFANQTALVEKIFNETVEELEKVVPKCSAIQPLEDGQIKYGTNGILLGSTARFECNDGYAFYGSMVSLKCIGDPESHVKWNGPTSPRCVRKECQTIRAPEKGQVVFTNGHRRGSSAYFRCNLGYVLQGRTMLTCSDNENMETAWIGGNIPSCLPLVCPDIMAPKNGGVVFSNHRVAGSLAYFWCDAGYILNGPPFLSCSVDQSKKIAWTGGNVPKCSSVRFGVL